MKKIFGFDIIREIIPILLSSGILCLAFLNLHLDFLVWIGFLPLFFALEGKSAKSSFFLSFICGFFFFALSMYWITYVTPFGWILLSLYLALYFGLFGMLFSFFCRRRDNSRAFISYFGIPAAWVLFEYLRSIIGGGAGWNLLGYSQYKNLAIIQIADIFGVWGVSFLVMLFNIALYNTIKMAIKCYKVEPAFKIKGDLPFKEEIKANPVFQTLLVLIIFASSLSYGNFKLADSAKGNSLRISVIQGNINQYIKWDLDFYEYIKDVYKKLTIKAAEENPDLIIWPETAVPGYLNEDKELQEWLTGIIKKAKIPVLAGVPMVSLDVSKKSYNSAILFSKKAAILKRYDKLHLVPFGEFVPFENLFPFLRKMLPITGSFISGTEYTVFQIQTPPIKFSTLICFEDIFPGLVRGFVRRGADFLVNITNDAWFEKSPAAFQHAASSVFRAVENRRPVVRAANTGYSCFIDDRGRIYDEVSRGKAKLFVSGFKTTKVILNENKKLSIYSRFGEMFIIICLIILIINIPFLLTSPAAGDRRYN